MGHPSRLGLIDSQEPIERDHPLNQGLVAWWLGLDGNWGGSTLHDLTGSYPGTLTNGPTWSPGPHGFAGLTFDGSDDYVSPPNLGLSGGTARTFAGWLYTTTTTLDDYRVAFRCGPNDTTNGASYGLLLNYLAAGAIHSNFIGVYMYCDPGLTAGVWTHVCMNYIGGGALIRTAGAVNIYLNGKPVTVFRLGTGNYAPNTNETAYRIGSDPINGRYWSGGLQDFRFYNRALSADEVYALYEQSLRGHPDTLRRYSTAAWFVPDAGGGGGFQAAWARGSNVVVGGLGRC